MAQVQGSTESGPNSIPMTALAASMLVAYGNLISGIYSIVFWDRFGVQPFQHGGVSELIPAGIAAVAILILLVFLGAGLGQLLGQRIAAPDFSPRVAKLIVLGTTAGVICFLIWGPKWRFWLGIGIAMQIIIQTTFANLTIVPERLRTFAIAAGVGAAAGYAPAAAAYFANIDADRSASLEIGRSVLPESIGAPFSKAGILNYVGRIGEDMVFFDPCERSTKIVRVRDEQVLVYRSAKTQSPRSCSGKTN